MDLKFISIFLCIVLTLFNSSKTFGNHLTDRSDLDTYIVQLEFPDDVFFSDSNDLYLWHQSFLPTTSASSDHSPRIIHSYCHVLNGFAAVLSSDEVKEMEKKTGFVSARPQMELELHTTHTPSFLGFHQNVGLWNASNSGKGIIIGLLDTGINPLHPSFNDKGMLPPPAKWKGKCEFNFRDGHGTHTSSTAAGNFVEGANFLGNANGTAVGIAPRAHVAMYRVCISNCKDADILAGFDAAIEDGVDVISISFGALAAGPLDSDVIAIGSYGAIAKGIFVSSSAGNQEPNNCTVINAAPWMLTVAASTTDRKISAEAILGNGTVYEGESAFQPTNFSQNLLPLVNGDNCRYLSTMDVDVKGKIVLCNTGSIVTTIVELGERVRDAGGAAMIVMNIKPEGYTTFADVHVLPATHVTYGDGQKILKYMNSTSAPVATISFKGTRIGDKHAPTIASFSARGPYITSSGILKPDISGPGVNILAAWKPASAGETTAATSTFNIISGTSMACPHLAGVAALLKNEHPHWSPAAIKSAIITTADFINLGNNPIQDETLNPASPFSMGSGNVNPSRANDPGLIYDIQPEDYVSYLCGLKYTDQQVSYIVKRKVHCTSSTPESHLNYPSFSIPVESAAQTFTRTVTNVGEANSTYAVKVFGLDGVEVTVNPTTLKFSALNQKVSYNVTVKASALPGHSHGYITWSSDRYSVRSPIQIFPEAHWKENWFLLMQ
ncbi:subtilisin-like protease [Capsicum galapagoense]